MELKTQLFLTALESFERLVNVPDAELGVLSETLIDGLQNGKVQKFEYTLELCWKAIKTFLQQQEGLDEVSPKKIVKAFFLSGYLNESSYLQLIKAIDDRNQLSHVDDQEVFKDIVSRLKMHASLMRNVAGLLQQSSPEISPH